ncbi:spore germination protein [Aneurinibacillus sp. Ricciae_BoGa-3]|nr:spore germination protein [Aneurinibacillus sp. Ricciae_BoGa-3]WCK55208.1 spore germination protein [Aneurinibacillus sp. Ricciae_BoGa-3]
MPSFVGSINIVSMDHSSIVNLNETEILCPKSASKSFNGSGGSNTVNILNILNGPSVTNNNDPHFADANVKDL